MANLVILQPHTDTYDGVHTYSYQVGEVHLIGGPLMPTALSVAAIAAGWGASSGATAADIEPTEYNQSVEADSPVNLTPQGL